MLQGMETEGCAQFFTRCLRVTVTALNEKCLHLRHRPCLWFYLMILSALQTNMITVARNLTMREERFGSSAVMATQREASLLQACIKCTVDKTVACSSRKCFPCI